MAYDGFMAAAVLSEIKGSLEGAKIEKITQPEADQIVMQLELLHHRVIIHHQGMYRILSKNG